MKRFVKHVMVFTAILLLGFSLQAKTLQSNNQEAARIGIINVRVLLSETPQAKSIAAKLEKEFGVRRDEIVAVQKDLQVKTDKLKRDREIMSDDQRKKLEKAIFETQREFKKMQVELREDSSIRQREETEHLLKSISDTVNNYAKQNKFDLILHRDAAPFVSEKFDITTDIIKLMSKTNNKSS